ELLELHRLPGAAGEDPLSARTGREAAARAHAQRIGPRDRAHDGGAARAVPARRRKRGDPRGAAALSRRREGAALIFLRSRIPACQVSGAFAKKPAWSQRHPVRRAEATEEWPSG